MADKHGTGAAKIARSVVTGVLQLAVDNGVQQANAIRQVRAVQARKRKDSQRDTRRAFTPDERDAMVAYADKLAATEGLPVRTERKYRAVADLLAFLAGTGVRIAEARSLRWENVDLANGRAEVIGTNTKLSHRVLTLPAWLTERLRARAELTGGKGYVFGSPVHVEQGARGWDQSNCADAVADVLREVGYL